jgi:hypothetical protein
MLNKKFIAEVPFRSRNGTTELDVKNCVVGEFHVVLYSYNSMLYKIFFMLLQK